MPENPDTTGEFLGGLFKTCPSCGELIRTESTTCRFCGATVHDVPITGNPAPKPLLEPVTQQAGLPGNLGTYYTLDGSCIPPAYHPGFDPRTFCWPAFFFADYWYAEKGLLKLAKRHFLVRIITASMGILALVALIDAGSSGTEGDMVTVGKGILAGSLGLIWFSGVFASTVIAWMDARIAYRTYLDFYNRMLKVNAYEAAKHRGLRLYWQFLYIPFSVFLLIFLVMITLIKNN